MALGTEIIILIVLLALSGFFSGAEVALVSLTRHKVQQMVRQKKSGAIFVEKLKVDNHRMLSTILIGNNIVNVGASALATSIAIGIFQSYAVGIATGVMTLLILVFGEITPKSIAASKNESVSRLVAPSIWYLSIVLAPILDVLEKVLNAIIMLFGIKTTPTRVTEEEIISMIQTAEEEGTIKEVEKKMIHSIFDFDDINVEEIATPRVDMAVVDEKCTIKKAMDTMMKRHYSRVPVYKKSRDNIVGIIYIKDLIKYIGTKKENDIVKKVMKKPYFVPETKKISGMLRQFQKRKEHMAIVVDEHGTVAGLVTLEDVLEEIVGEIMDETDKVDPHIRKIDKKVWIIRGKTEIEEVNEKLKMRLKGKDYDTFSGFILKHTGKIPRQDEVIKYGKFRFKIEEVEGNRISKVRVEKK